MEPIYANKNIKKHVTRTTGDGALSEESYKSDDITYSEVHIINSNQKREKEQVIYSAVGFSSSADLAQNVSGDPSPDARSKVNTGQDKERLLLVGLCVLLLAVALTVGTLYGLEKMDNSKESQRSMKQLQEEKDNLTIDLQKRNRTIEKLLTEKENLTMELENLKKKAVHCAVGWMFYSGSCYYFSTDEKTWPASRDACISEGGDLVIMTSPGEQDFLKRSKSVQNKDTYWIGLTDAVEENDWRWLDGTKLSKTPKLWTGNEPDNWNGTSNEYPEGEDCAVLDLGVKSYGFLDAFCSEKKYKRICETKAGM